MSIEQLATFTTAVIHHKWHLSVVIQCLTFLENQMLCHWTIWMCYLFEPPTFMFHLRNQHWTEQQLHCSRDRGAFWRQGDLKCNLRIQLSEFPNYNQQLNPTKFPARIQSQCSWKIRKQTFLPWGVFCDCYMCWKQGTALYHCYIGTGNLVRI